MYGYARRNRSHVLKASMVKCQLIPSINPRLTSQSTLNEHLHWYSFNSWLTVSQESANFHRKCHWAKINTHESVNNLPTIDQPLMKMSIKCQSRCRWSIDLGYWLALNHGCLYHTWSKGTSRSRCSKTSIHFTQNDYRPSNSSSFRSIYDVNSTQNIHHTYLNFNRGTIH